MLLKPRASSIRGLLSLPMKRPVSQKGKTKAVSVVGTDKESLFWAADFLAGSTKELIAKAITEEDLRIGFEKLLQPICERLGIKSDPRCEGRVWVNAMQCFDGIEPQVWQYHIGGYQVLDKWLKDRKGRTLTAEDVKHYCRVVTALTQTIWVQGEIDKLYPRVEEVLAN